MTDGDNVAEILKAVSAMEHSYFLYSETVSNFFRTHPKISSKEVPVIHSVKSRIKKASSIENKILRKNKEGRSVTSSNFFQEITDIAGVRVLHLHLEQLKLINDEILKMEKEKEWIFVEKPKAYTWDPETDDFMKSLGFDTHIKPSYYTSVHYVVRPRRDSPVSCEIQVRTLFEEIWGEVDHLLNYPDKTTSVACKEQLKVLAKLVGAGSRLVDSVFRTHDLAVASTPKADISEDTKSHSA